MRSATEPLFDDLKREKFRVYEFAKRYNRCLFVDADCWIRPSCPDSFSFVPETSVAMHDDYPNQAKSDWLTAERRAIFASQGIEGNPAIPHCFNSGVVMCSKATAGFWLPPKNRFQIVTSPNKCISSGKRFNLGRSKICRVRSTVNFGWAILFKLRPIRI